MLGRKVFGMNGTLRVLRVETFELFQYVFGNDHLCYIQSFYLERFLNLLKFQFLHFSASGDNTIVISIWCQSFQGKSFFEIF